jgi:pimeloyl-ACP methyl ester carboxylesterase
VIGRSYGGETAIDLALRYPDRVRALALLEAALLSMSDEATRRMVSSNTPQDRSVRANVSSR